MAGKTILMIGAFDTKGAEYAFLREQILARGPKRHQAGSAQI